MVVVVEVVVEVVVVVSFGLVVVVEVEVVVDVYICKSSYSFMHLIKCLRLNLAKVWSKMLG